MKYRASVFYLAEIVESRRSVVPVNKLKRQERIEYIAESLN